MVDVAELTVADESVLADLNALLPQLSSSSPPMTIEALSEMVTSDASRLLVARRDDDGAVLGMMTLVVFRIPTGVRAWIEDVVVDESARGTGAGAALNRAAIALAYELGAKTIDLTSRPSRVAANALYQKLGFVARDTNIYRHDPTTR